jgi:hypothetical protein
VPAAPRGQHEHGCVDACLSPLPQQREPVDTRQAQIEHDGVVTFRVGKKICTLAVGRGVDRVTCLAESHLQLRSQRRFVFHDQHPHVTVIPHRG